MRTALTEPPTPNSPPPRGCFVPVVPPKAVCVSCTRLHVHPCFWLGEGGGGGCCPPAWGQGGCAGLPPWVMAAIPPPPIPGWEAGGHLVPSQPPWDTDVVPVGGKPKVPFSSCPRGGQKKVGGPAPAPQPWGHPFPVLPPCSPVPPPRLPLLSFNRTAFLPWDPRPERTPRSGGGLGGLPTPLGAQRGL